MDIDINVQTYEEAGDPMIIDQHKDDVVPDQITVKLDVYQDVHAGDGMDKHGQQPIYPFDLNIDAADEQEQDMNQG
jgi:hypothetical protein